MRHLIDPLDFTMEETTRLLDLAERIRQDPAAYQDVAQPAKSWQRSSMSRPPAPAFRLRPPCSIWAEKCWASRDARVSSATKGETVADTIRVVSCFADIAAMRHPKEGAPLRAARYSRIPVINAGDGGHSHPTQTLLDMLTIRSRIGTAGSSDHRLLR